MACPHSHGGKGEWCPGFRRAVCRLQCPGALYGPAHLAPWDPWRPSLHGCPSRVPREPSPGVSRTPASLPVSAASGIQPRLSPPPLPLVHSGSHCALATLFSLSNLCPCCYLLRASRPPAPTCRIQPGILGVPPPPQALSCAPSCFSSARSSLGRGAGGSPPRAS